MFPRGLENVPWIISGGLCKWPVRQTVVIIHGVKYRAGLKRHRRHCQSGVESFGLNASGAL